MFRNTVSRDSLEKKSAFTWTPWSQKPKGNKGSWVSDQPQPVPRTGPAGQWNCCMECHKMLIDQFRCKESQHFANDGNLADFVSVKSPYNLLSFHWRSLCVDFYFYWAKVRSNWTVKSWILICFFSDLVTQRCQKCWTTWFYDVIKFHSKLNGT